MTSDACLNDTYQLKLHNYEWIIIKTCDEKLVSCNLKQEAHGSHRSPGKRFQSIKLSQCNDYTITLARPLPPF